MDTTTDADRDLLAKARIGNHQAFQTLVAPYETELQRHCYRMTGSMDDADDIVQETLFRAWRGLGTYASRGSFRAWLYKIATNRSLDLIKSAPRRREMINTAHEPPWLQPYPQPTEPDNDVAELDMIGLAFISALQNLPGRQRSALILRDVLGFSTAETAEILGCSEPAAKSALQRARSTLAATNPTPSAKAATAAQQQVADEFVDAWRAADTSRLLALLHDTVHMTMPPHVIEIFGRLDVADFLLNLSPDRNPTQIRVLPISANSQAGIAMYLHDRESDAHQRHCLMLFELGSETIIKITGFDDDRIFDRLGLPTVLT